MCTLKPLPQLVVLAAPWEAPLQWALFLGTVLTFAVLLPLFVLYGLHVRRRTARASGHPTRLPPVFAVALGLVGPSLVLALCSAAVYLFVLLPALDRLDAWYDGEFARLLLSHCDRSAFYSAYSTAWQTLGTWRDNTQLALDISITLVSVASGLGVVGKFREAARRDAMRYPA